MPRKRSEPMDFEVERLSGLPVDGPKAATTFMSDFPNEGELPLAPHIAAENIRKANEIAKHTKAIHEAERRRRELAEQVMRKRAEILRNLTKPRMVAPITPGDQKLMQTDKFVMTLRNAGRKPWRRL